MSHSFSAQIVHIVFGTKGRRPFLTPAIREPLYAYTGGILKSLKSRLIKAGGVSDHVHILAELHASVSIADCVRKVKSNTSRWIKRKFPSCKGFAWQRGYAAFTVSQSQVGRVKAYIEKQAEHHRGKSFRDELREFLLAHDIEFDDKDLLD